MYDITMYGSNELILHVFNDEDMYGKAWELYRDVDALRKWVESLFRFSPAQVDIRLSTPQGFAAGRVWRVEEVEDDDDDDVREWRAVAAAIE